MIYDLAHMAYERGLRADIEIPLRGPTQTQEDDMRRVLNRVVRHWETSLPTLVPRGAFDAAPGSEDIKRISMASEGVVAATVAALWHWVERLDGWARSKWVSSVKSSTGIGIDNMAPRLARSADLQASVQWAVALIGDLDEDMRRRVQQVMIDAATRGLPRSRIEEMLREQARIVRRRTKLIARDQTQKIAAKLNELQQRAAGIERYAWQHSFLPNPRDWHVRRQGLVFRWDKPPRDGHPGHAINCRCTASALLRPQTRREAYL